MHEEGKPRDADEKKGLARTKMEEHAIIASVRRWPERRTICTRTEGKMEQKKCKETRYV